MLHWALCFAGARETQRVVLMHTESVASAAIEEAVAAQTVTDIEVETQCLGDRLDEERLLTAVDDVSVDLLVLGQNLFGETSSQDLGILRRIFDRALCDSIILRLGSRLPDQVDKVMVPTSGGPHAQIALRMASRIVKEESGQLVPVFVESDIGEEDGRAVGLRILKRYLDKAGLNKKDNTHVHPEVVISNDVGRGIARAAMARDYDLVLIGASNSLIAKKKLFGILPKSYFEGDDATTVALVKHRQPMGLRLRQRLEKFLSLRIPQLEREERVALFERLQTQSVWSFDFVVLILLSTGIASLGLIQSSPAVVIGAMLVAPLMTPLLGSGMSLVQGNLPLMLECIKAIIFGFLSALVLGVGVGYIAPITELTSELAARGGPNLLDLGVATLSGIAASYCVARPSLSSALAGVAIAAALVPPIATVGISMALREWSNAIGAALLFGTNVVAIIIAAAITFFAIGIRGQLGPKALWARRTTMCLLGALAVLVVPLSTVLVSQAGKSQPAAQSRAKVESVLAAHLPNHKVTQLIDESGRLVCEVSTDAPAPVTTEQVAAIRKSLQQKLGRQDAAGIELRVLTRLVAE